MTVQTLEQLKAENAKAEKEGSEKTASPELEDKAEVVEEEIEQVEQIAESDNEDDDDSEIEAWRQSDEQQSNEDDDEKFTSRDIAAVRRKLKAKLQDKDDELESLKQEIERLKSGNHQPTHQSVKPKPTLESVDYDEAEYEKQMADWLDSQVDNKLDARSKAESKQRQMAEHQRRIDEAVDRHLERAMKLDGIEPENYQAAELNVRRAIEEVIPKSGDIIADNLIEAIGEGSEKLFYQLGVNSKVRQEFQSRLRADVTGTKALIYLGELKGKLTSAVKKRSAAPKPAASAEGGSGVSTSESALKRKYQNAKTPQERFNIRRQAKEAGIKSVNEW